ncbi:DNA polymerase I [Granulosicoccus antarcticus]|uniref:DNA polymerase I n=1 Tax=Granulosicoccus antarcticus IMCC3135 TaxID=1192854 RepID=A0A2Z2NSM7_9GAMM|nr:DNA polymerase I [Granulosicoccus antarcticus]ASJ70174.1 DNA polymerase I [Granulosicoccus antarcticus IMCC3135]
MSSTANIDSAADRPVILVDGSAYLYRAFHAMPPLTNAKGQPTGAIYGVVNMLRRLVADYQPTIMVVIFDASGKTFRDEIYTDYKANRASMPDDMRSQIKPLYEVVEKMGFPLVIIEGVEADDVIGTLSVQASLAGLKTVISTGDKDMAQLVNEHVSLVNTMTNTHMDVAGVKDKFGVAPERIIDYLALVGDTSDNIPGVPSCGPKTAVKWLDAHGSLQGVIDNAESVKGKIGEKLRDAVAHLPMSYDLATIRLDVELPQGIADMTLNEPDIEGLTALYQELEFKTWSRELAEGKSPLQKPRGGDGKAASGDADAAGVVSADVSDPVERRYETILTLDALDGWISRLEAAELFAFDTETTSLDYMVAEVVGVSFSVAEGEAAYVPLAHDYEGAPEQLDRQVVLERLRPLLEGDKRNLVGQHIKYDINVLRNHGIELVNVAHDTMLESYVIDSTATRHDMDSLARKYLDVATVKFEDVAGKGKKQLTFNQIEIEAASQYAAEDADITLRLHQVLWPRLVAEPVLQTLYETIEIPALLVLSHIEYTGVRIDAGMLEKQGAILAKTIEQVKLDAYADAGREFNLGSPKQIGEIFFDEKQFPIIRKTPKGQPSTAEDVLEQLALDYPLPKLILQHRSLTKLMSTYIEKLPLQINPKTQRVHTSYNQAIASTGRLSSTDPNLQNIPVRTEEGRRIREAFIAEDGYRLLAADYSQIELRIMAHLSGDKGLVSAFEQGLDVHKATAAEVFGVPLEAVEPDQRRSAKAINFGLIYGMSAFGLAKQLDIARGEAQSYINLYFERYPDVKRYMDETRALAKEQGYVETVFGRRLYLPDINARSAQLRNYAERTAINAPMQGTAADIIKRAMINVDDWLRKDKIDARIIMQVHDELVLEVKAGELESVGEQVEKLMIEAADLKVPLEVDVGIGNSWEEAH